jgi:hypothetical protein
MRFILLVYTIRFIVLSMSTAMGSDKCLEYTNKTFGELFSLSKNTQGEIVFTSNNASSFDLAPKLPKGFEKKVFNIQHNGTLWQIVLSKDGKSLLGIYKSKKKSRHSIHIVRKKLANVVNSATSLDASKEGLEAMIFKNPGTIDCHPYSNTIRHKALMPFHIGLCKEVYKATARTNLTKLEIDCREGTPGTDICSKMSKGYEKNLENYGQNSRCTFCSQEVAEQSVINQIKYLKDQCDEVGKTKYIGPYMYSFDKGFAPLWQGEHSPYNFGAIDA